MSGQGYDATDVQELMAALFGGGRSCGHMGRGRANRRTINRAGYNLH